MAHRTILTPKQREVLFGLPADDTQLLKHYTLSDEDLDHIGQRRRPRNRLGFALQFARCAIPDAALLPGEVIPVEIADFLAAQLGLKDADLDAWRRPRRNAARAHGQPASALRLQDLLQAAVPAIWKLWLHGQAEHAVSNEDIARRFVEECRRTLTILPAISTIERLCADALVAAEKRIETRIADRLSDDECVALDDLLFEMVEDRPDPVRLAAQVRGRQTIRPLHAGCSTGSITFARSTFRRMRSTMFRIIASPVCVGRVNAISRTDCVICRATAATQSLPSAYRTATRDRRCRGRDT